MAAKKIITQPDILDLESLGAFMDAQQDPVEDSPSVAVPQATAEESIQTVTTPTAATPTASLKEQSPRLRTHPRTRKHQRERESVLPSMTGMMSGEQCYAMPVIITTTVQQRKRP